MRILLLLSILICLGCQHHPPSPLGDLSNDLDELLEWFPGDYDNDEQVKREQDPTFPDSLKHRHTHHIFREVGIEGIPGRQLYAQQYQHYDPTDIYRQRIYSFEVDTTEMAVRLTIYTPNHPENLIDLHLRPELQNGLRVDDFYLKPGCEVFWKRNKTQFEGYLKKNACSYYSNRFEKRVFLNETLILRKDALFLDDTAVDVDGNLVFGVANKGPTINKKQ